MKILADEKIPYVKEAFGNLGKVVCVPGTAITREKLTDVEAILVRTVTKVNRDLLEGSGVRFVGTASVGTDHIDEQYLREQKIVLSSAPGSNANSVVEYVVTVLLYLAQRYGFELSGKRLGIIGVGNIGSRLERKAQLLGMQVLGNDPPRERLSKDKQFVSLDEALGADIITLHVPLARSGPDATYHLIDEERLRQLRPGTILINTSRGPVVDNQALKKMLQAGKLGPTVLDVWENEPAIDAKLLELVAIGTPHIAGYSQEGKFNQLAMMYKELSEFVGRLGELRMDDLVPRPDFGAIALDSTKGSDEQLLAEAFSRICDVSRDDAQLRKLVTLAPAEQGQRFRHLRESYPVRREAECYQVHLSHPRPALEEKLAALGFGVTIA